MTQNDPPKSRLPAICLIHLGNRDFARVDAQSLPELRRHLWRLNDKGYVIAVSKKKTRTRPKIISMHHLVLSAPRNSSVHHKNHQKLDNRRSNLKAFESDAQHRKECHPPVRKNTKVKTRMGFNRMNNSFCFGLAATLILSAASLVCANPGRNTPSPTERIHPLRTVQYQNRCVYSGLCAGRKDPPRKVFCGNELCLTLRVVAAGGFTAEERAIELLQRLVNIMEDGEFSFQISTPSNSPGSRTITIGKHLAITVTPIDAIANDSTVDGLAVVWASRLLNGIYITSGMNR